MKATRTVFINILYCLVLEIVPLGTARTRYRDGEYQVHSQEQEQQVPEMSEQGIEMVSTRYMTRNWNSKYQRCQNKV
jgi:hypothetical protein